MKAYYENGIVRLSEVSDFDPVKVFECGQCFRWNADEEGIYTGVAFDKVLKIWRDGDEICLKATYEEYERIWRNYFDMDTDYEKIRRLVSIDEYMTEATQFGAGIRILRQNSWEALCSFIISQCNNIPRIKGIVERLCKGYGEEIETQDGIYYSFPDVGRIAATSEEELAPVRAGFRAGYIINAARAIDSGELDLDSLKYKTDEEALSELKGIKGIGDKVASCVMLFGLYKIDAFPIDVWMKKTIKEHYDGRLSPCVFNGYAGIAQQYMFYHARSFVGENRVIVK